MNTRQLIEDAYKRTPEQVARDNWSMSHKYRITNRQWADCKDALKQFAADLAQKRKEERK